MKLAKQRRTKVFYRTVDALSFNPRTLEHQGYLVVNDLNLPDFEGIPNVEFEGFRCWLLPRRRK